MGIAEYRIKKKSFIFSEMCTGKKRRSKLTYYARSPARTVVDCKHNEPVSHTFAAMDADSVTRTATVGSHYERTDLPALPRTRKQQRGLTLPENGFFAAGRVCHFKQYLENSSQGIRGEKERCDFFHLHRRKQRS